MVESVDQRPVRLVAAPDQLGNSHGCGCRVARGRGLDVDAHRHVPVPREVQDRFEARDPQAGELTSEPRAGVESFQLTPGEVPDGAPSVRRLLQGSVHHRQPAVASQLDIALDQLGAQIDRAGERFERVFRNLRRLAAMRDDQRPPLSPPPAGSRSAHTTSSLERHRHDPSARSGIIIWSKLPSTSRRMGEGRSPVAPDQSTLAPA
jgi:hypothetical protein